MLLLCLEAHLLFLLHFLFYERIYFSILSSSLPYPFYCLSSQFPPLPWTMVYWPANLCTILTVYMFIRMQISKAANWLQVYLGRTKLFITGQFSLFSTTKAKLRSARKHIIFKQACNPAATASQNPTIQRRTQKLLPESEAIVVVNEHHMQVRRNPSHYRHHRFPRFDFLLTLVTWPEVGSWLWKYCWGFWGLQFGRFHMAKVDTAVLFVFSAATLVSLNNSYYSVGGKNITLNQYSSQACPSRTVWVHCFNFHHLIENECKMNVVRLNPLRWHWCGFSAGFIRLRFKVIV